MTAAGPTLPDGRWTTDHQEIAARRTDRSGWEPAGSPLGVALAESVRDVQETLRYATATRTPVTVRGAGTGLAGGAAADDASIVLDLTGLNRIREISLTDAVAVVEPGVLTADLDRAANSLGLRYAPDPASAAISTIGGNIATNAGGLRCAKYGVTRDSVLGLDVVLANGDLLGTGRRTIKGVAGYDLTGLFVGSEGTLGVIVGATLRLRPVPRTTVTIAASFVSLHAAIDAVTDVSSTGITVAMAEVLDEATLRALDHAYGTDLSARGDALLLVQTDGAGAESEADTVQASFRATSRHVTRTSDPVETEQLLQARRNALPALEPLGHVFIEDIAVPRSRMAEAALRVAKIGANHGVQVFVLGHAADGNLHPIIVVDAQVPANIDHARDAAADIFTTALKLGGTITGEHGVGVLKRQWLATELGDRNHDLQLGIRAVFDPLGILNPGRGL